MSERHVTTGQEADALSVSVTTLQRWAHQGLVTPALRTAGRRVHPATGCTMTYMTDEPTQGTDIFVGDRDELSEAAGSRSLKPISSCSPTTCSDAYANTWQRHCARGRPTHHQRELSRDSRLSY
ncbi:MAG: hypothetical protein LBV34_00335 [Nocardiopsaceae bacterium]|jgi:uncharacterized protein (DUF3084 family)|nr:hypothetical protein [Nocardiopsaceae bacterium]